MQSLHMHWADFDSTVLSRHALRPVADSWIGWSTKWTRQLENEWARLLKLKLIELLRLTLRCQRSPDLMAPPFWLQAQSYAIRAAVPFCWLLLGSCTEF